MTNGTSTSIGLAVVLLFAIVFGLILTRQSSQYGLPPATASADVQTGVASSDDPVRKASFTEPSALQREQKKAEGTATAKLTPAEPVVVAPAKTPEVKKPSDPAPAAPPKADRSAAPPPKSAPLPREPAAVQITPPKLPMPVSEPMAPKPEKRRTAPVIPAVPSEPVEETDRVARADKPTADNVSLASAPDPAPSEGEVFVVRPSDTLSKVARAVYGRSDRATIQALFEANRDQLKDINRVKVGQRLRVPPLTDRPAAKASSKFRVVDAAPSEPLPSPAPRPSAPVRSASGSAKTRQVAYRSESGSRPSRTSGDWRWHVVKRNESLREIARRQLGNGERWREIYSMNKDRIRTPNRLIAGMRLRVPLTSPAVGSLALLLGEGEEAWGGDS